MCLVLLELSYVCVSKEAINSYLRVRFGMCLRHETIPGVLPVFYSGRRMMGSITNGVQSVLVAFILH